MTLSGQCVVCGKHLSWPDYEWQAVIALVGPEGIVAACVSHAHDGPDGPDFQQLVRAMAERKAAQLGVFN